jgi:hypothetical protein
VTSTESTPSDEVTDDSRISDAVLRSVLEFAVGIAAAGSKLRPPLPFPAGLRPYFKYHRLDRAGLAGVRKCVVADTVYRGRLASVATPDLVDEIGVIWLQRPGDWVAQACAMAEAAVAQEQEANLRNELSRAERRREAAERNAARAQAELLMLRSDLQIQRAGRIAAEAEAVREGRIVAGWHPAGSTGQVRDSRG